MTYITFTHVDALTGVPVTLSPARNGPAFPVGASFGFALESRYPTPVPTFYGQTDGATDVPGILSLITKAEYDAAKAAEMEARRALLIPTSITMRQARLQLSRVGKLKAADDAIAGMTGQPGEEARVEWEFATTLRRDHPLVAALGRTLGLDDPTIDDLFRTAAQIS